MAYDAKAHITGTVWKIEVKPGDKVEQGTVLVILESMKMEMPVEADDPGTVEKIHIAEGQAVTEGDVLVSISLRVATAAGNPCRRCVRPISRSMRIDRGDAIIEGLSRLFLRVVELPHLAVQACRYQCKVDRPAHIA